MYDWKIKYIYNINIYTYTILLTIDVSDPSAPCGNIRLLKRASPIIWRWNVPSTLK